MNGAIGEPVSRVDGPDKVSGRARYTADTPLAGVLHAVIVPATRPKATITEFDLTAASVTPGVIRIFTHRNTPKLASVRDYVLVSQHLLPLQDDRVLHEGQPVALVVADTLERATEAAPLVKVSYREEPFDADFLAGVDGAEVALDFLGSPPRSARAMLRRPGPRLK